VDSTPAHKGKARKGAGFLNAPPICFLSHRLMVVSLEAGVETTALDAMPQLWLYSPSGSIRGFQIKQTSPSNTHNAKPDLFSDRLRRMRLRLTFEDAVVIAALVALVYFRNWWAILFLMLAAAFVVARYYKTKKSKPPAVTNDNEFVIENRDKMQHTAEIDVGLGYRSLPNHFRTVYRDDTFRAKSLYEYRLEGTDVLCRLIEDSHDDIGIPRQYEVRDGVVLESDLRKRDTKRSFHITDVEDKIADLKELEDKIAELKKDAEWHKMESRTLHGLKYFIISKKLPQADARRYLRQELERLKAGEARFFKEAEKLGLEREEGSKYIDRLKVADGKTAPPEEEIRKLFESAESFGITSVEFSWGKEITGVLEKLLRD
jgi:hypothetical protein